MKYCSSIWLTGGRLPEPATDQTLLMSVPMVQCPGWVRRTTEGPRLNLPWPRMALVAVGITNAGPTPQISLPGLPGDRKNDGFMSPKPNSPPLFWLGYGCQTIGWIMRVIRFQLSLSLTGITGWMFRTSCVRLYGPTLKLLLF